MGASPDVIVVGLGAVGSSALLALARRGARCIGFDRYAPPHELGSSHGRSRLIRLCYFEHPDYVPLLRSSYALWDRLQAEWPEPIIRITGGVYLGARDDPFIAGSLATANTHGLAHELLSHDGLADRFPQFRTEPGEVGFFEPTAGVLFPESAVRASLAQAESLGAQVLINEPVRSWVASRDGVTVHTDTRTVHASAMILCTGPWIRSLAPMLAPALTVTRQVLAWFRPADDRHLHAPQMPAWAVGIADGSVFYGFPMFSTPAGHPPLGGPGFKIALHKPGATTDPDHVDRRVHAHELASLAAFLRRRIPDACRPDGESVAATVCLYTSTPDHHFLIDTHPDHRNVVLISACSGHGFKLSSATGQAAADLATDGTTGLPIGFLRRRWGVPEVRKPGAER
ncbi:MAG: N-methyl-L-tryptophan oxidase [Phycisphaerales bacterium]|nr:N-methyl-L-tryptophan oxidase [Phycisphaerales bacterium]